MLRNLCVSAYPDVQPWQVQKACCETPMAPSTDGKQKEACTDEYLREFYYKYLSMLLHPVEGHDSARQNEELVQVSVFGDNIRVEVKNQ